MDKKGVLKMEEKFVAFLFRRIGEKIGDIQNAASSEDIDYFSHELGGYVDELNEVVKMLMGA